MVQYIYCSGAACVSVFFLWQPGNPLGKFSCVEQVVLFAIMTMLYVMLTPTEVLSVEVNVGDDLLVLSGEVGRSWRYCNARPTRDEAGASS